MMPDYFPGAIVPKHLLDRRPPNYDHVTHKEKVEKEKKERKSDGRIARRKRIDERPVDINRLCDDIARLFIAKQQGKEAEIQKQQEQELVARMRRQQRGGQQYGGYDDYYGYGYGYDDYYGYGDYGDYYGMMGVGGMMGYGYQGDMGNPGNWGYEDHGKKKGSGRGRGILGLKPLTAYHQTHTKFAK